MLRDEKINIKMQDLYEELLAHAPEKKLQHIIAKKLDRCGIMYRAFSRIKTDESLKMKLEKKKQKYEQENRKMQDIIGIRIVLYFKDDIDICIGILKQLFCVVDCEHDEPDVETFRPQRINYVCCIPEDVWSMPCEIGNVCRIDNTFEIQVRTIFSEGWHEVEHDIRYKYKEEWNDSNSMSRELNGLLAVLEVCDNNILSICNDMAYQKYKTKQWESMLRNKLRIRLSHTPMDGKLIDFLNSNHQAGKELYRFERKTVLDFLSKYPIPRIYNNLIYIFNELEFNDKSIQEITPLLIREKCADYIDRITKM